jgi:hypothetical protein
MFENIRSLDVAEDVYHADTTRISASMLKTAHSKTMAHVWANFLDPERFEIKNPAFDFGSMFHAAILEQGEFDNRFVIVPEGLDRRTKDGKALWSDIEASGKTAIKHAEWQAAQVGISKLLETPFFGKHNPARGLKERAILADGARCKPDLLFVYGTRAVCVDIKTCADVSQWGFSRAAFRLGYHIQAAWYSDMVTALYGVPCEFYFACSEKSAPYLPAVYQASESMIIKGREHYQSAYSRIENAIKSGWFEGYQNDVEEIDLPDYAYIDDEEIELNFE